MTLADKVTSLRLVLAPVFFAVYLLPRFVPAWFGQGSAWTVPVLWALFIVTELTDMIDGMIARKRKEVSDFGKLYDPFADTLVQLTYFLCFVIDGILPVFLLLIVLYREFCILFIRNLMLRKGAAMGARMGGKIKTVSYISAGILALLASSSVRLGLAPGFYRFFSRAAAAVFAVSVVFAVLSFADYLRVYKKT
ncbi:MAG: CDP-diacylglycerol--glycerol-3-phosphate 3-phosphatidyltransferase [Treponema sp.]|jgi:CDP-diacylglycerol--glycerol-3-phosphate 3-phosphatidyltransferase|nr:CDP-diacylglycerol--glycerol-3-phosphate 3-phosphatidyltransferase [Treponema sp.]